MIVLTEQQQQALGQGQAPRVLDPTTNKTYVLVEAAAYERLREALSVNGDDEGLDMRQVSRLVERAMREDDADDPSLAHYQPSPGARSGLRPALRNPTPSTG